jgi:hypothetical protein
MLCSASPQIGHVVLESFSAESGCGCGGGGGGGGETDSSADRWPHDVHVVKCVEPRGIKGMKKRVKNRFDVIWVCEQVTPQCEQVFVM